MQPVKRNYHSDNNNDDSLTSNNNMDISDDGICGELDSSQQLSGLKSKKIVDHEAHDIVNEESSNSTNVSMNGLTSTGTSLPSLFLQCLYKIQGLSLQYLHRTVITILCLPCLLKRHLRSYTYYYHYEYLYK